MSPGLTGQRRQTPTRAKMRSLNPGSDQTNHTSRIMSIFGPKIFTKRTGFVRRYTAMYRPAAAASAYTSSAPNCACNSVGGKSKATTAAARVWRMLEKVAPARWERADSAKDTHPASSGQHPVALPVRAGRW